MLSEYLYNLNIYLRSLSNMASDEGTDEAEQLRLLALQSMVRRSKPKPRITNIKLDEKDDQDILLLRAAALKTIVPKNNSSASLLVNENGRPLKSRDLNGKRPYKTSPLRKNKLKKLEQNMNDKHLCSFSDAPDNQLHKKSVENFKNKHYCRNEPEVDCKVLTVNNDNVKKIVKNGSMQLSNLDSEKIDETLVLHITFSSSDSDDSSSEYDYLLKQKNQVCDSISNAKQELADIAKNFATKPLEDKKSDNVTECMQRLTGLMKHCESELKERNQQMTILLDAYEKYKNHNQKLCSIIKSMKSVRDELSECCVETDN